LRRWPRRAPARRPARSLVTGANRGIGLAFVPELAARRLLKATIMDTGR